jgi:hypothetical protein
MSEDVKLTKAMRRFMASFQPGSQNGVEYDVQTVWTRRSGNTVEGLKACREAGLITSAPDDVLRPGGWRHDLTPAGRAALGSQPQ